MKVEEFFSILQVVRKDLGAAIDHIEAMKRLLDWSVRAQSTKRLKGQFEVFEEIVAEVIKVDMMKVLFFDAKTRSFSTVCLLHQVEVDEASRHFVATETMMTELKSLQTMITPYYSQDGNFDHNIELCFDSPVASYAFVPMVDSSTQEFSGSPQSSRSHHPCQQVFSNCRYTARRSISASFYGQRFSQISGSFSSFRWCQQAQ